MEIPGYTLHGDYYLSDKIVFWKSWGRSIKMKEVITLPNGKKVIAHTLSKKELETIPRKERKCDKWYWTSTLNDDSNAWYVNYCGDFIFINIKYSFDYGGARLGFHKSEIKQLLDIE